MKIFLRALLKIIAITLAACAIIGLIGLVNRWQTAVQFSDGLFWAGALLAGVGILMTFGDKDLRLGSGSRYFWSSPQERQARLAGVEDPETKVKRSSLLTGQTLKFYLILFISAVLIILIGYLVTVVFPAV